MNQREECRRHDTANSVMASAKRLIELRQDCRNNSRMAEISVPACPIPIHHTKFTMAKPHPIGMVTPQMPTPRTNKYPTAIQHHHREQKRDAEAEEPTIGRGAGEDDRAILSVTVPKVYPGSMTGALIANGRGLSWLVHFSIVLRLTFQFWIRVANLGQIRGSRPGIQVGQQTVVACDRLEL